MAKRRAFRLAEVLRVLRREMPRFARTTLAEVSDDRDPFRLLCSCVISLRTRDAVTAAASARLFALATAPATMAALDDAEIARAIYPAGFFRTKAGQLREIARRVARDHGGAVPRTLPELLALPGVGLKTANLVLGLGHGVPAICVDVHVHRITNRWGLVATKAPDDTEGALRALVPRRNWIELNDLLVTWGQNVCLPRNPRCSGCAIASHCGRVGVERSA